MSGQPRQPYLDKVILAVAHSATLQASLCGLILASLYLWHMNRAIATVPEEFTKLIQKPWTKEEMQEAYRKAQESPRDVTPYLLSKKNRRYIVIGGSGLIGGWIVQHLLMRGEDPAAIRILDLSTPTRPEVAANKIKFIKVDVGDSEAVSRAYSEPWPKSVSKLPITVFHTVGLILVTDRKPQFLAPYMRVNADGPKHSLKAAKENGVSIFISTSSGSVGMKPPSYFPWPWQRWPKNIVQFCPNADRPNLGDPLEKFPNCYVYSKAQGEKVVRDANNSQPGFLTGSIRPSHVVYGHGVKNPSSVTWDYLRRGGSPSWIHQVPVNFVSAVNVSIGHLAYEEALLKDSSLGGRAYCVTDPNPPATYEHLYNYLMTMTTPLTPVSFPYVPHIPFLFIAYGIETYNIIRERYLTFLPAPKGDVAALQPAMLRVCTLHALFTDDKAKKEIGYKAPVSTLEGLSMAVVDWNRQWEDMSKAKANMGKVEGVDMKAEAVVPKSPFGQKSDIQASSSRT